MVLATLLSSDDGALVSIIQPSPMTSFNWSDFPLVHQFNPDDDECIHLSIGGGGNDSSHALHHTSNEKNKFDHTANTLYAFSSTQWLPSMNDSAFSIASTSSSDSSSSSTSSRTPSGSLQVSFAPRIEVREYDMILGDHPSCDLLPLSLGWTYHEQSFQGYSSPKTRRHGNKLKLTYLERKNLLRRVGGYSEEELQHSQKSNQHHVPTTTQFQVALS